MMRITGSYTDNDVIFLLKDLTNIIIEQETTEREQAIQSGKHYSEMLPVEYKPSAAYLELFYQSLGELAAKVAAAAGVVAELIIQKRGFQVVFVSLARAGTPVGILIKRYLAGRYQVDLPHYSISIIRGKGIDENAINYILQHHPEKEIQFIDGWTGKGAIARELNKACADFNAKHGIRLNAELAVLADPGYCAGIYGTREDFLIPSACLNATVSGLISRTIHRTDLIKEKDFHGAKCYRELAGEDLSNVFIDTITAQFPLVQKTIDQEVGQQLEHTGKAPDWLGWKSIARIQEDFGIADNNLIKPGVGETTRVLLRRVPWKILVKDAGSAYLKHVLLLAKDRGVPVEIYPRMVYRCCGLIKPLQGVR